eukprot:gene4929-9762_t
MSPPTARLSTTPHTEHCHHWRPSTYIAPTTWHTATVASDHPLSRLTHVFHDTVERVCVVGRYAVETPLCTPLFDHSLPRLPHVSPRTVERVCAAGYVVPWETPHPSRAILLLPPRLASDKSRRRFVTSTLCASHMTPPFHTGQVTTPGAPPQSAIYMLWTYLARNSPATSPEREAGENDLHALVLKAQEMVVLAKACMARGAAP